MVEVRGVDDEDKCKWYGGYEIQFGFYYPSTYFVINEFTEHSMQHLKIPLSSIQGPNYCSFRFQSIAHLCDVETELIHI